jgi:hypothetical protein
MKFSYRGCTETMLPAWPGGTYFIAVPSLPRDLAVSPAGSLAVNSDARAGGVA